MSHPSVIQIWEEYRNLNPHAPEEYSAWAFGNSKEMADELAELVVAGIKTATASLHLLYELEDEELPYVGLYNVILDGDGRAVAVVETTAVEIIPFLEVSEEHAFLEGEGDRTLEYWREVHETFFKGEFQGTNIEFDSDMLVVCEKFKVVYKSI